MEEGGKGWDGASKPWQGREGKEYPDIIPDTSKRAAS
jgi:hypothetical protein